MANSPLPGWWKATMWGMSPACDLLELIDEKKLGSCSVPDKKEVNVLLVGQKDIRHSLQTLKTHWKTLKENDIRLNLYVVESCLELYARQILFWNIAFEPTNKLELDEKVKQFGEVHGNSMIRRETWKTVTSFCDSLIKNLTGGSNSTQHWMPLLDLSEVAYQERNRLVEIIKFWTGDSSPESVDMSLYWNNRIRQYLGIRYDEQLLEYGLFTGDYYGNVVEKKGLLIIDKMEYHHFRSLGYGFKWEEEDDYNQPNLTLASSAGNRVETGNGMHGFDTFYWGDIITGPFICHGVECEDPSAFKSVSRGPGIHSMKRSTDITIRNLHAIFATITNDSLPDAEPISDNDKPTDQQHQNPNPNVSVHFVSMSNFYEFPSNLKYKEFFDVVYFGNSMIDEILPSLSQIFAPDVILFAENARYAYDLSSDEEAHFTTTIKEVATNMGFEEIKNFNSKTYECEDHFNINGVVRPSILKYVMKSQENNVNGFMF